MHVQWAKYLCWSLLKYLHGPITDKPFACAMVYLLGVTAKAPCQCQWITSPPLRPYDMHIVATRSGDIQHSALGKFNMTLVCLIIVMQLRSFDYVHNA